MTARDARPTARGWRAASAGGIVAIRAVASVWPYITKSSTPQRRVARATCAADRRACARRPASSAAAPACARGRGRPVPAARTCGARRRRRDRALAHRGREARVDDGRVGQHDPGADGQVRVQDGEPVAVVQRQRRDRPVARVMPSDAAIARALQTRLVCDRRTSLAEPVDPDVLISSASSGCRTVPRWGRGARCRRRRPPPRHPTLAASSAWCSPASSGTCPAASSARYVDTTRPSARRTRPRRAGRQLERGRASSRRAQLGERHGPLAATSASSSARRCPAGPRPDPPSPHPARRSA